MKSSITAKLILSYAAVIFMMAGISISFISLFSDGYIISESNKKLQQHADDLVVAVSTQKNDLALAYQLQKTFTEMRKNDYALAIFGNNGEWLTGVHYESLPITLEDFKTSVKSKLDHEGAEVLKHSTGNFALFIRHLYDVDTSEKTTLVLYMQVDRYGIDRSLFTLYLMALCVAALVAVCFALIFSSTLTLNLKKLKVRANMLAKRNYDCSIKIESDDEVGDLSEAFDAMAKSIEEYDLSQKIFLQNASHELRTPLMSIRGYTEGLRDGVFENTEEVCAEILDQTSRLEKIIEDIMYLTKMETSKNAVVLEEASTLQIIDEAIDRVQGIAVASNISIVKGDIAILDLRCDVDNFCIALTNVLSNCLRFAKSEVFIQVIPVTKGVCFTVSDDGPGIHEEDLVHIFDRFYKGKKGKHGLGLSIAKAVVTSHGGVIHARNKQGEQTGAIFEIFLPINQI